MLFVPATVLLACAFVAPPFDGHDQALVTALDRAFPGEFAEGAPPPGDAVLLHDVLRSEAFAHAPVGPLDVYVYRAGDLAGEAAEQTLLAAQAGLAPLGELLSRHFDRPTGLISGRRFPIVLASQPVVLDAATGGVAADSEETGAFDELIALLGWCDVGPDGFTAANGPLWTDASRGAVTVRTWDVQLVNLAHPLATSQGEAFFEHGLGYYTLAHLVNRLLRLGSWGLVPPWMDQGLIDELDIEAYGRAWVGGESYTTHTEGWFRPGWSGFVPQGTSPPAPVTGPPADLATTVRDTSDPWASRKNSPTRHWAELVADLRAEYPPSFAFMAEHESFLPRDRAYARCLMHLLIETVPEDGQTLLSLLDTPARTLPSGMYDSEPLPSLVARAVGGVPDVERLAAEPLREKLPALGHAALVERIEALGGGPSLELADHRDAGDWLYEQLEIDGETRQALFTAYLEAEYHEQLRAWLLLGVRLDQAMRSALGASATYPDTALSRQRVAAALHAGLHD
ncbi:MAG: hypothetical protein ACYTG2_15625 [Planctomycetota bacterium]|jgi:hypothetical protein